MNVGKMMHGMKNVFSAATSNIMDIVTLKLDDDKPEKKKRKKASKLNVI